MEIKPVSHFIKITLMHSLLFYFSIIEADFFKPSSSDPLAKKCVLCLCPKNGRPWLYWLVSVLCLCKEGFSWSYLGAGRFASEKFEVKMYPRQARCETSLNQKQTVGKTWNLIAEHTCWYRE